MLLRNLDQLNTKKRYQCENKRCVTKFRHQSAANFVENDSQADAVQQIFFLFFFQDIARFIFPLYSYMMKALWHQHWDKFTFPDNISCDRRADARVFVSGYGQCNLTIYLPKWTWHFGRHNYTILYCKLNILFLKARIETCLMQN